MSTDTKPTQEELREQLSTLVSRARQSAWTLASNLGRDHKYFARKISGERPTYLTDVYAVEHAVECEEM